ncbi:hypothetical protein CIPAW_15G178400 [Carya illinoinensis]|uniref:Transmembrane protein n=1 Tax=Carya illinoinensis TaxID=32201 RepID=A0A8T1NE22_CARIL|nr:hypothetical protein CIPAW_15G178400 [Carya illinoinensis]KAG6628111.1 hypothetical protein CIPAW_15G178400 [Carya illinoinensis]KAG6628112.1 hypothetical protein CIPAW_15G178400 [Carya illinoinensis]
MSASSVVVEVPATPSSAPHSPTQLHHVFFHGVAAVGLLLGLVSCHHSVQRRCEWTLFSPIIFPLPLQRNRRCLELQKFPHRRHS